MFSEDRSIVLFIDIFFIAGIPFLVSFARRLCMLIGKHLESRSVPAIRQALDSMLAAYATRRFTVSAMMFDGEGALSTLTSYIQSKKGIQVNTTAKNEHVPDIERAGRTIKERVRVFWNTLPYKLSQI